ncbi:hypothetical protein AB0E08_20665 [Streptomyces sp. NPDC048281]|uniref:effector-associated constant component EACC1 n=1 Tax=Streptomyces sp. NPDC048281 TaxID=3154715 RepID=UPI003423C62C
MDVKIFIEPQPGEGSDDLAEFADDLKSELAYAGKGDVDLLFEEAKRGTPVTKGPLAVVGALFVRLEETGWLRDLLGSLFGWVMRTDRAVEISVDGVEMKLARATPEEQQRIVQAVLERIATGS